MKDGQLNASKKAISESIAICDDIYPTAGGVFRGTLALLYMKENNIPQALKEMENAEPLVKGFAYEYGKLLCKKSQILWKANQKDIALLTLKKAIRIEEELETGTESELSRAIRVSQKMLSL